MKIPWVAVTLILCAGLYGDDVVRLSPRFQTVYILEMSNALDQHLASRLTNSHVLWVVLDPASADAVLTESLDSGFQTWIQRTYPPPANSPSAGEASSLLAQHSYGTPKRGTVFLVDPRKKIVLWSTSEVPRNSSPAEADRVALRMTNELKAAFGKK